MMSWSNRARCAFERGDYGDPSIAGLHRYPALLKAAGIEVACSESKAGARVASGLVQNHMLLPVGNVSAELTPATRVLRFMVLLKHLGTAPWASGRFEANESVMLQLAAAHMALISHEERPSTKLFQLLGAAAGIELTQNVVWITNRQQGKTTLIGKFIAALAIAAKPCKTLACVYSTKLDRASELARWGLRRVTGAFLPPSTHADRGLPV